MRYDLNAHNFKIHIFLGNKMPKRPSQEIQQLSRQTQWQAALLRLAPLRAPLAFDVCSAAVAACGRGGGEDGIGLAMVKQNLEMYLVECHISGMIVKMYINQRFSI